MTGNSRDDDKVTINKAKERKRVLITKDRNLKKCRQGKGNLANTLLSRN